MSKSRKRKDSDQIGAAEPRKRPPSKRQTKQEKQQVQQQTQQQRPAYPPTNYYPQPATNDYLYAPQQYYDQQRQPSPRNMVYAPAVSIPSANGPNPPIPSSSTATSGYPPNQPYNYPYPAPPQLQYSPYPAGYPSTAYYPQQQYQAGLLAPIQSNIDPNRLSPRPKSQNSNSTRTNSPQISALSPAQPSIKIPQVQPPNYPYPQSSTYPPTHLQYPPQWTGYGQQRFG